MMPPSPPYYEAPLGAISQIHQASGVTGLPVPPIHEAPPAGAISQIHQTSPTPTAHHDADDHSVMPAPAGVFSRIHREEEDSLSSPTYRHAEIPPEAAEPASDPDDSVGAPPPIRPPSAEKLSPALAEIMGVNSIDELAVDEDEPQATEIGLADPPVYEEKHAAPDEKKPQPQKNDDTPLESEFLRMFPNARA